MFNAQAKLELFSALAPRTGKTQMYLPHAAVLLAGISLTGLGAAPAFAEYQYLNTSDKEVVYFGKKIEKIDDTSVIFIKWKDPGTGERGEFTSAYRCSKGLTDSSKDPSGWVKVGKGTVGFKWMTFACN